MDMLLRKMCHDAVWDATASMSLLHSALRTVQYLVWRYVFIREAQCQPCP